MKVGIPNIRMHISTVAFIPGYHVDESGNASAFIQVITENASHQFQFAEKEFSIDRTHLVIKIGENIFTPKGITVHLENENLSIHGSLRYQNRIPLKYDIMGPFSYLPMQCKHRIISMCHTLYGILKINGEAVSFENGIGYIESDRGTSCPSPIFGHSAAYRKSSPAALLRQSLIFRWVPFILMVVFAVFIIAANSIGCPHIPAPR